MYKIYIQRRFSSTCNIINNYIIYLLLVYTLMSLIPRRIANAKNLTNIEQYNIYLNAYDI